MKKIDLYNKLSLLHKRIIAQEESIQLATVSGVVTTKAPLIRYVDTHLPEITLITTKSFQVEPNEGNREPIICEVEVGSFGNSVGLRNSGLKISLEEIKELRKNYPLRSLLNISLSASSIEDFITLVKAFDSVADILELNFSCPHAASGYGSDIGTSAEIASLYVKKIREATELNSLLFVKLTPNVDDIGSIAKSVIDSGADGLVAINTVGPTLHIEPLSQSPILQNPRNGVGGKSGRWIFERAVESIVEIREAVGEEVPIIGMGGVTTATDIATMIESGADIVGIGSAFGKVHQDNWPLFIKELAEGATSELATQNYRHTLSSYYKQTNSMEYKRRRVVKTQRLGENTLLLVLEGSYQFEAGQFLFLWLPKVGEKPFSIALSDPLTFIVKKRGAFTQALFELKVGDYLYFRGLYGEGVQLASTSKALLIGGGTGVAVLPSLAKALSEKSVSVSTYIGSSEPLESSLEKEIEPYSTVKTVIDEGVVARVLLDVEQFYKENKEEVALYVVGPDLFMRAAAKQALKYNVDPSLIFLSLEKNTMCGVGMCGECLCGERLTCQSGTFVEYPYYIKYEEEL